MERRLEGSSGEAADCFWTRHPPGRCTMAKRIPDHSTMRAAVALAARAPSVFNTQPWQWRVDEGCLHLLLDRSRTLPVTDPLVREAILSCGAALHHACLALSALGWHTRVHRAPDTHTPDRLATLDVASPRKPSTATLALASAAADRRTDRREYSAEPVSAPLLDELAEAGRQAGVRVLIVASEQRYALARAFAKAAALHGASEQYRNELAGWTGRSATAEEGVAEVSAPQPGTQYGDLVLRDFGRIALTHEEAGSTHTAGTLLLISTVDDDRPAWLRTGEATSTILCTARRRGLGSSPLSEAFEIDRTRAAVRHEVLADRDHPQIALRLGWPPTPHDPPATSRRAVQDLLLSHNDG